MQRQRRRRRQHQLSQPRQQCKQPRQQRWLRRQRSRRHRQPQRRHRYERRLAGRGLLLLGLQRSSVQTSLHSCQQRRSTTVLLPQQLRRAGRYRRPRPQRCRLLWRDAALRRSSMCCSRSCGGSGSRPGSRLRRAALRMCPLLPSSLSQSFPSRQQTSPHLYLADWHDFDLIDIMYYAIVAVHGSCVIACTDV